MLKHTLFAALVSASLFGAFASTANATPSSSDCRYYAATANFDRSNQTSWAVTQLQSCR